MRSNATVSSIARPRLHGIVTGVYSERKGGTMSSYKNTDAATAGPLGWIFFMAYIGAAVYFYQQNPGLGGFFLAILQAAVWPAYVLFEVLHLLGV